MRWRGLLAGIVLALGLSVWASAQVGPIGGNPFNQTLNTTSNVTFNNLTVNGTCTGCGGGAITGADTQVLFFDGANSPAGNGALTFKVTGAGTQYAAVTALAGPALKIGADDVNGNGARLVLGSNNDNAAAPDFLVYSSNGTNAVPVVNAPGEQLFRHQIWGYDGSAFQQAVTFNYAVSPTGTVSAGHVPGTLTITALGSGSAPATLTIDGATQTVGVSNLSLGVNSAITLGTGSALQTDTTDAHLATLNAYDVDGAAYATFATLLNGNTPSFTIAPPSGGTVTVNATTLQQAGNSITLSGNLTTTGSFNPTFAIPSSSTWTFPSGGGTLAVGGGSPSFTAVTNTSGTYLDTSTPASITSTSATTCGTTSPTFSTGAANSRGSFIVGATAGSDCTLTFSTAAAHAWVCASIDETTNVLVRAVEVNTTSTKFQGVMTAGDKIGYLCAPY